MSAAGPGRVGDLERTWNSSRPRAPSQHAALHSKARFWRGRRCCTSNRSTAASTARDRSAIAAWAAIALEGSGAAPPALPSPPLPHAGWKVGSSSLQLLAAANPTLHLAAGAARRATSTGGRADANDGGGGGGGYHGYASGGRFFGGFERPGRGPGRPRCPLGGQLRRKVRSSSTAGRGGAGRGGAEDPMTMPQGSGGAEFPPRCLPRGPGPWPSRVERHPARVRPPPTSVTACEGDTSLPAPSWRQNS